MGLIIKDKKHYVTRFPLWLLLIVFIGFSPLIIGLIGEGLTELFTGKSCNESNCFWGALPWLMFYTVPIGLISFFIFLIIIVVDSISLLQK